MMHSSESLAASSSNTTAAAGSGRRALPPASPSSDASFHDIAASIAAKTRPVAPVGGPPALLTSLWNAVSTPQQPHALSSARSFHSSAVSDGTSDTARSMSTRGSNAQARLSSHAGNSMEHAYRSNVSTSPYLPPNTSTSAMAIAHMAPSHPTFSHANENITNQDDDGATLATEYAENGTILGSVTSLTDHEPSGLDVAQVEPRISSSMGFSFSHVQTTDSMLMDQKDQHGSSTLASSSVSKNINSRYEDKTNDASGEEEDLRTVASETLSLTPTMVERDLLTGSGMITQSMVTTNAANVGTADPAASCKKLFPVVHEGEEKHTPPEESTSVDDMDDLNADDDAERFVPFLDADGASGDLGSLVDVGDEDISLGDENYANTPVIGGVAAAGAAGIGAALCNAFTSSSDQNKFAPPSTLEPDMVLCPFCQSEKDLKWHLNRERSHYNWAYRIFGVFLMLTLMAGSFFAGSHTAKQSFEPILAEYADQCQEKIDVFKQEQLQRQEQIMQLTEQHRMLLEEREAEQQVAIRTEQNRAGDYMSYLTGGADDYSALWVTALGGVASGLSGVLTSYLLDNAGAAGT